MAAEVEAQSGFSTHYCLILALVDPPMDGVRSLDIFRRVGIGEGDGRWTEGLQEQEIFLV